MSIIKIFLVTAILFIVGYLTMYPTESWLPSFFLELIPDYYHDKSLWKTVVQDNQPLWYGLGILTVLVAFGWYILEK